MASSRCLLFLSIKNSLLNICHPFTRYKSSEVTQWKGKYCTGESVQGKMWKPMQSCAWHVDIQPRFSLYLLNDLMRGQLGNRKKEVPKLTCSGHRNSRGQSKSPAEGFCHQRSPTNHSSRNCRNPFGTMPVSRKISYSCSPFLFSNKFY